jgi:hypothetical protein
LFEAFLVLRFACDRPFHTALPDSIFPDPANAGIDCHEVMPDDQASVGGQIDPNLQDPEGKAPAHDLTETQHPGAARVRIHCPKVWHKGADQNQYYEIKARKK